MSRKKADKKRAQPDDANQLLTAWTMADAWLSQHRPSLFASLCPGATEEQLAAKAELEIPLQLRQWLMHHNGQDSGLIGADVEAHHMFNSSDGAPLLLLGVDEMCTHKDPDNWERVTLTLHGAKKPASTGSGRGRGSKGLGVTTVNKERWSQFYLIASSEPLGAEESSVGVALVCNEAGKSAVVELSLQHATIDEAQVVADDLVQWLGQELKRMQSV
jgi:cell wall assembly regulator SMI1